MLKATHEERENWRKPVEDGDKPLWFEQLSETEQFVIRMTLVVVILAAIAYVVANADVLEAVRVVNDFAANIITEVISIAITVLVIERLNERRANELLKQQLLRQVTSSDNGLAILAVNELNAHGWLQDGSLRGINLSDANLKGAKLYKVDLEGAYLSGANLEDAWLYRANLKGAQLDNANLNGSKATRAHFEQAHFEDTTLRNCELLEANLNGAWIEYSDMQGADLNQANLEHARLEEVNLTDGKLYVANLQGTTLWDVKFQGADLTGACLKDAKVEGCLFDEKTVLPDDQTWSSSTDIARFTSGAWQPDEQLELRFGAEESDRYLPSEDYWAIPVRKYWHSHGWLDEE